jgi:histone acetyltransferase (RNA polymerase elongator complex component)
MMIGLPGDSEEKSLLTARKLIVLKPDIVRIYPALVI